MSCTKIAFKVENSQTGKFDLKFESPWGKGKVRILANEPPDDLDLLRLIAANIEGTTHNHGKLRQLWRMLNDGYQGCIVRGRQWAKSTIAQAIIGQPDPPEPHPVPVDFSPKTLTLREAKHTEYAVFNGGPHLCVDVPDGSFTISCRTSEGKKITFAFCPYTEKGPAKCVDVKHHTSEATNGDSDVQLQEVIAFSLGSTLLASKVSDHKPCSLVTFLLRGQADREKDTN